jgi:hypothetical protein
MPVTAPRTQTDRDLSRLEDAVKHDPERADVIARVRRFKAGWYELAEKLTELKRNEKWRKWGHANFDDYCRRELHLRKETVDKLTGSFSFLQKKAPEVLQRDPRDQPLPSYQAVDFLRRAEEESGASDDTLSEVRRDVLDEALPAAQVARRYREVLFPVDAAEASEKRRGSLRTTAAKLIELLAMAREDGAIPKELVAEIEEPLSRLVSSLEAN